MPAVIIPLRRSLWSKLRARLNCAYTRWLIVHAEQDLARQQAEFEHASKHLPAQIKVTQAHIHALTVQLTRELRNV
jgi:hypothetical protein